MFTSLKALYEVGERASQFVYFANPELPDYVKVEGGKEDWTQKGKIQERTRYYTQELYDETVKANAEKELAGLFKNMEANVAIKDGGVHVIKRGERLSDILLTTVANGKVDLMRQALKNLQGAGFQVDVIHTGDVIFLDHNRLTILDPDGRTRKDEETGVEIKDLRVFDLGEPANEAPAAIAVETVSEKLREAERLINEADADATDARTAYEAGNNEEGDQKLGKAAEKATAARTLLGGQENEELDRVEAEIEEVKQLAAEKAPEPEPEPEPGTPKITIEAQDQQLPEGVETPADLRQANREMLKAIREMVDNHELASLIDRIEFNVPRDTVKRDADIVSGRYLTVYFKPETRSEYPHFEEPKTVTSFTWPQINIPVSSIHAFTESEDGAAFKGKEHLIAETWALHAALRQLPAYLDYLEKKHG